VEKSGRPDLPLLSVYRDYGVIPREGREDNYNKPSADLSGYKIVQERDLVINKMKAWQGSLGVSDYDGIVSPAYFIGRPIGDAHHRFLHHLLRSSPLIAEYGARSKGIRPSQWDLPWDEFASIKVRLPTSDIQRRLANYLDTETARIEALTEKKARIRFEESNPADVNATWANIEKAEKLLGWRPGVRLADGLAHLVEWYAANREWVKEIRTD